MIILAKRMVYSLDQKLILITVKVVLIFGILIFALLILFSLLLLLYRNRNVQLHPACCCSWLLHRFLHLLTHLFLPSFIASNGLFYDLRICIHMCMRNWCQNLCSCIEHNSFCLGRVLDRNVYSCIWNLEIHGWVCT